MDDAVLQGHGDGSCAETAATVGQLRLTIIVRVILATRTTWHAKKRASTLIMIINQGFHSTKVR